MRAVFLAEPVAGLRRMVCRNTKSVQTQFLLKGERARMRADHHPKEARRLRACSDQIIAGRRALAPRRGAGPFVARSGSVAALTPTYRLTPPWVGGRREMECAVGRGRGGFQTRFLLLGTPPPTPAKPGQHKGSCIWKLLPPGQAVKNGGRKPDQHRECPSS